MRAPHRTAIMASERAEENKFVFRRAAAALASRDFELAARLYKGLLKNDPENRDVLFALGDVYVKSGDDARALPYYEKINKIDPNDAASLIASGGIYRRLGRYDDALRSLRAALSAGGDTTAIQYNLGFTYRSMGDYDKAIECFESVIAADPGDTLAYNHLGAIYALRKEYQKAMTAYKRGLQIDPNHPVLQLNLAETYEAVGADGEAAVVYEAVLRAKPGNTEAVRKYAALLLRRHKTEAAAAVVTKAIALYPSDAGLFALLGRIALKRFDYEAAVSALKKALTLDPKNTTLISCLADAYEKKGALENGAALIRQAENDFPSDAAVGEQYVRTLLSARDYESAFAKLRALYAENQNDVQILDLYGQYYICRGEDEKTASCYKKINSIDAQYFAYEKSASRRFMQTGRFDKARNFIARYLSKYPSDEEALVLSAEIDTEEGKLSSALAAYRAALAVDGGNVSAKNESARIEKLLKEADGTQNDYTADENDKITGAEIVMDSPETKATEASAYGQLRSDDDFFDFDLAGESLLKADDEIDPFTIADRESDEEMRDSEAEGLDLLIPSDRPIDKDATARAAGSDDVFNGRTGPAAGIDESLSGNIEDVFGTENTYAGFEAPIILPRSKAKRVNYEDEPVPIAENAPVRRPSPKTPFSLPLSVEKEARAEPGAREQISEESSFRAQDVHEVADALVPERVAEAERRAAEAASRKLEAALEAVNARRADELEALRRSYDEAHRTRKAARDAVSEMRELIDSAKKSVERIRSDAEHAESKVKGAAENAMKKIRDAAEKALPETDANENISKRADGEGRSEEMPRDFNAALEKAMRSLPDIAAALQNRESVERFSIELDLFKKLRAMCDFLPPGKKEKFMISRTRLLLDYVIARLSGRPGLLATAEALRKIKLPAGLLENGSASFSALTDEQLVPLVIHDMRTKLTDLPDPSLAAALDAAASEALENARGR